MFTSGFLVGDDKGQIKCISFDFKSIIGNDANSNNQDVSLAPKTSLLLSTSECFGIPKNLSSSIHKIQILNDKDSDRHFVVFLLSNGSIYLAKLRNNINEGIHKIDFFSKYLPTPSSKILTFSCYYQIITAQLHLVILFSEGVLLYSKLPLSMISGDIDSEVNPYFVSQNIPKNVSILSASWNDSYVDDSLFAIGGDECPLSLYKVDKDRNTLVCIFKAANNGYDELNLKPRLSITGIVFISSSVSFPIIALVTLQRELCIYDCRVVSSKPIFSKKVSDNPITNIYYSSHSRMLIYTDNVGGIFLFDESSRKPFGKLKGHVGAVQCISCPEKYPILLSIGLDRYLHVFSLISKKLLVSIYFTQKLLSISDKGLLLPLQNEVESESLNDNDYDDVWQMLGSCKKN